MKCQSFVVSAILIISLCSTPSECNWFKEKWYIYGPGNNPQLPEPTNEDGPIFGARSLYDICSRGLCTKVKDFPDFIDKLFKVLEHKDVLKSDGVGRKPGNMGRVKEIKNKVNEGNNDDNLSVPHNVFTWNLVVSLLKRFLMDLKSRVIDGPASRKLASIESNPEQHLAEMLTVLNNLPRENRVFLSHIFVLIQKFHREQRKRYFNQMTSENWALCIQGSLCTPADRLEDDRAEANRLKSSKYPAYAYLFKKINVDFTFNEQDCKFYERNKPAGEIKRNRMHVVKRRFTRKYTIPTGDAATDQTEPSSPSQASRQSQASR